MMIPQQQQQQFVPMGAAQPNGMVLPQQQMQQFPAQGATQQYYNFPEEGQQQQQGAAPLVPLPAQGAAQYYTFPEEGQQQQALPLPAQQQGTGANPQYSPEEGVKPPAVGTGATQQYTFPEESEEQPKMMAESEPVLQRAEPRHHHSNLRHQQQQQQHENVQYFYYDPQATIQDEKGNIVYLPQTVYDSYGQPVSLQSLSTAAKEIQIQPPSTMIHHNVSGFNTTILNVTHPNTVDAPVKGMSIPSGADVAAAWGDSTASDSSIIVATVGVMALLVGALSARRMRARSILAACIENESLEDDAAYDTAYTVGSNHYNTFQQGWKGDLEKFDV